MLQDGFNKGLGKTVPRNCISFLWIKYLEFQGSWYTEGILRAACRRGGEKGEGRGQLRTLPPGKNHISFKSQ